MVETEKYGGEERRTRDRSRGIVLRRRRNELAAGAVERRRAAVNSDFDIASALELHLDECTTRRAMLSLLESWLSESNNAAPEDRDEGYSQAVENAIAVVKNSPDVLTAIAILQRAPEES